MGLDYCKSRLRLDQAMHLQWLRFVGQPDSGGGDITPLPMSREGFEDLMDRWHLPKELVSVSNRYSQVEDPLYVFNTANSAALIHANADADGNSFTTSSPKMTIY